MKYFITILITLTIFNFGCHKCNNLIFCPMPQSSEKYFGIYKENNYWVYKSNKSLIDSIYVSNYNIQKGREKTVKCLEWDEISFNLNSKYLSNKQIQGEYKIYNEQSDCSLFTLITPDPMLVAYAFSNIDTLYLNIYPKKSIKMIGDYDVGQNKFLEVICLNDKYWFAANIGLIQYIPYNSQDTFKISNYKIQ